MNEHGPRHDRPAPDRIQRTTSRGKDQYVLACNFRHVASDEGFARIRRQELVNRELRAELDWKVRNASTRTARWFHGKLAGTAYAIAFLAYLYGWMFTPDGRYARVSYIVGEKDMNRDIQDQVFPRSFITSDMTQHEIDSLVAAINTNAARRGR